MITKRSAFIKRSALAVLTFAATIGSIYHDTNTSYAQSNAPTNSAKNQSDVDIGDQFFGLLVNADPIQINKALNKIKQNWSAEYMPMAVETLGFAQSEYVRSRLLKLIDENSPKKTFKDNNERYQWLWNQDLSLIHIPSPRDS